MSAAWWAPALTEDAEHVFPVVELVDDATRVALLALARDLPEEDA